MASIQTRSDKHDDVNSMSSTEHHDGLRFETVFCPPGLEDPMQTTEWELRSAEIKDEQGNQLFEQTDCEVPTAWSQLATNVVVNAWTDACAACAAIFPFGSLRSCLISITCLYSSIC